MRGSEVRFYSDIEDMRALVKDFKNGRAFIFTKTLSELDAPLTNFDDPECLMRYLRTDHPQHSNVFLITEKDVEVNVRSITMQDGSGIKLKASQPFNPDGVLIRLGGQLREVLIATSINTTAETARARKIFKVLKKLVTANAEYIDGFYVLPGALEKLQNGWRLTPDPGFSRIDDLKPRPK